MKRAFDLLQAAREAMVADQIAARGVDAPVVLDAMRRVPREVFVPPSLSARAYDDGVLPIGEGQTLSQPYVVALMTQAVLSGPGRRVLEVGTGSGYQSAVLCEAGAELWTVERLPALSQAAKRTLEGLGCDGVRYRVGDGSLGWSDGAPFDGILVAAAAPSAPPALLEQLAGMGRLVIPVGSLHEQRLLSVSKAGEETVLERVRFVPLIGEQGFKAV